ncbi:hypothetical protein GCM10027091_15280 [Streptomyces daliensis]
MLVLPDLAQFQFAGEGVEQIDGREVEHGSLQDLRAADFGLRSSSSRGTARGSGGHGTPEGTASAPVPGARRAGNGADE